MDGCVLLFWENLLFDNGLNWCPTKTERNSRLLLWTLLTGQRRPKARWEHCPGKPPEGHLGLSLLLWMNVEEVCASLASAAGLRVVPQEYFCLYFRGWATSGLSAQEQAPKGIKPQYQDPCYRAAREKVKSFGSGLTLWLLRAPAGRSWGKAWGEMIWSLKPTAAHMTSCRASPSLCFTLCAMLNCTQIQQSKMWGWRCFYVCSYYLCPHLGPYFSQWLFSSCAPLQQMKFQTDKRL